MDYEIDGLMKEHNLPEQAEPILDSIAYRLHEVFGPGTKEVDNNLVYAAEIASRYDDPVAVLRMLDNGLDEQQERGAKNLGVGSLEKLYNAELKIDSPVLRCLEDRIREYLCGIAFRPVRGSIGGRAGPRDDDGGPWQQNAVRSLEG